MLDVGNANSRNEEALGRSRNKHDGAVHPCRGVSVVEGGCGGTAYDCGRGEGHRDPLDLPRTGDSGRGALVSRLKVIQPIVKYLGGDDCGERARQRGGWSLSTPWVLCPSVGD